MVEVYQESSLEERCEADVHVEGAHPVPVLMLHVSALLPDLRGHLLCFQTMLVSDNDRSRD